MHFDFAQCKQRGSTLPLLVIFVILISGIIGFLIFNSSNKPFSLPQAIPQLPKPQPQVYSNQKLSLQFEYSDKDFTVKENSEEEFNRRGNGDFRNNFKDYVGYEPAKFLGAAAVLDKSNSFDTNPLSVWVFDNPDGLTVDKWFDRYWYYPYVWGVFDYASKSHIVLDQEATISGQQAKYKVISYQPGKPKFIYIAKDKKMYLFRVIGEAGDKLLSNVEFLASDKDANNQAGCKITGCSGQICADKEVVSTCEYLPKYDCYKNASCERQGNGECGWTQTDKLTQCLNKF